MSQPVGDEPRAAVAKDRRALHPYIRVQQVADREMMRVLKDAQRSAERELVRLGIKPGIGAAVRADQLRIAQQMLLRKQSEIWTKAGDIIKARRADAAAAGVDAVNIYDEVLFAATGDALTVQALHNAQVAYAQSSIDLAHTRLASSRIDLAHSVYRAEALGRGDVERLINAMIARGTSARELARAVSGYINPSVRGGVSYAAMRLGRTELNNAFHASQALTMADEPWVGMVKWNLSSSHPKPDNCDAYAKTGKFAPAEVPPKPHPQCLCFITPVTLTPAVFLKRLNNGEFDSYLSRMAA